MSLIFSEIVHILLSFCFYSSSGAFEQVESGSITTGASLWVQGIVVASQGSKQKVELKVTKVVLVSISICN